MLWNSHISAQKYFCYACHPLEPDFLKQPYFWSEPHDLASKVRIWSLRNWSVGHVRLLQPMKIGLAETAGVGWLEHGL